MRRLRLVLPVLAVVACSDPVTPDTSARLSPAPSPSASVVASDGSIPGQYVVTVDWAADALALARQYGLQPRYVYQHLLNGFAAPIADETVQALAADPRVLRVTVQRQMSVVGTTVQRGATWGLDRIDQRTRPIDSTYAYDFTGAGVNAYIIDTGIRLDHAEFDGRASTFWDAYASDPTDPVVGPPLGYVENDCHGHGTHVSGTVGGKTYGVAKQVRLFAVRVLNCAGYGSDADVIAGMEAVAESGRLPGVVNMSLGDVIPTKTMGTNGPVDDAVRGMVQAGFTVVVAAGNGWGNGTVGADACMFPIANVPEAITVAASNASDTRTTWTNFGACIDLFAPGSSITSATHTGPSATDVSSGTSMASPHVAGAAALVLQQAPGLAPAAVRDLLVTNATQNVILPTSLNNGHTMNSHLLYSRVAVPSADVGKKGPTVPCTPKRKRSGQC